MLQMQNFMIYLRLQFYCILTSMVFGYLNRNRYIDITLQKLGYTLHIGGSKVTDLLWVS